MSKTFINSFQVKYAQSANGLIYFLKKFPFIGKRIPYSLYKHTNVKFIFGVLGFILNIFKNLLSRGLYFGLAIYLPYYLIYRDLNMSVDYFFSTFFFLSFIIGSFVDSNVLADTKNVDYTIIRLMRADANEYYKSKILYKRITDFIYFLIPMGIISLFTDITTIQMLIILIELTCLRFFAEIVLLCIYNKTGNNLMKNYVYMAVIILPVLALTYGLPVLKITLNIKALLFNLIFLICICLVGILSLYYLLSYKKYNIVAKKLLIRSNTFNATVSKEDIAFSEVKLNEKKINKGNLKKKYYENKDGYSYLNSMFFMRFKSNLITPVKIRTIILVFLCLIGAVFALVDIEARQDLMTLFETRPTYFIFAAYFLSVSEKVCKALFYNCDSKLLRYKFYRKPEVILKNFKMRLKNIIVLNSIPSLVLCISIVIIVLVSGNAYRLMNILPLILCIICLSLFFSIHYLFLYYIIQPYTPQLTVKNPLFTTINYAIYFVCYLSMKLQISSVYFTLSVAGVTVIYMIIALLLVYKFAPKTFKF